jgi:DNA-binding GntR family transcriptional regulator
MLSESMTENQMTPRNPKDTAYDRLKTAILTLEMQPGADLDEARLSAEFGLSRTPMREVFRRLAGEGYVDLRQNRGARVSEMSHTTLRDFFLAAPMIYGAILRLAAENARPVQIDELKATQAQFRTALRHGSSRDRAILNNRFHEITGEMAGNIYLLPSFRRLLIDHARISMTFYRPTDADMAQSITEAADQHDRIISAIEARDATAADALATEHWNLSRNRIESFVMPGGLEMPLGTLPGAQSA